MAAAGVDYCGLVKTSHKGFLFIYIRKVDEGLSGRVISRYEEYPKISWLKTNPGHWVQVQL